METKDVSIDVSKWATDMKGELRALQWQSRSGSICKVPDCFRRGNEDAYTPQVISIGPLHKNDKTEGYEIIKKHYLDDLLKRVKDYHLEKKPWKDDCCLENLFSAVKFLEKDVRQCYSGSTEPEPRRLVEMMVIDGCFIIELFHKFKKLSKFTRSDPFTRANWLQTRLKIELLMLENQIPFKVLECIFDITKTEEVSLASLALCFFNDLMPRDERVLKKHEKLENQQHLLHLFHSSFIPSVVKNEERTELEQTRIKLRNCRCFSSSIPREEGIINLIHCATELRNAGIKFEKWEAESFLDVKFENGLLKIPQLVFQSSTTSVFLNLIAFEQCSPDDGEHFTAYISFINKLINFNQDVAILRRRGIIDNWAGSDDKIVALCKKLLLDDSSLTSEDFYLSNVCKEVNECYSKWWNKQRAKLCGEYFNSPWSIIKFLAATAIFIFTLLQAFYRIYSYHHPRN